VGSTADIKLDNGRTVKLTQETRYPWDGAVKMTVNPDTNSKLTINVRIPEWAQGRAVPGDLYSYVDALQSRESPGVQLKVNGKAVPLDAQHTQQGFASVRAVWKKGDTVEMHLPLNVRVVKAHEQVSADASRFALERGPLVYCAEAIDNRGRALSLPTSQDAKFETEFKADLLGGLNVIRTDGSPGAALTAIPYFAWSNRGPGEMQTWMGQSTAAHDSPLQ